ncbi:hypothetical protein [Nitratidesulfovibrio liaohensis]|uniref:Uncharacterized protein n=1 Tax=Nitratidesulfovibrio liaohensis TaxID=2604158 RepID=A0ABY9R2P9_9BACT|nr:hypothetical protein [Nitratidesulfovibrio liaohensis]WMW65467.1 hypothetical protein KPS_003600 [Nitratidesulfovibrio liaohensis]
MPDLPCSQRQGLARGGVQGGGPGHVTACEGHVAAQGGDNGRGDISGAYGQSGQPRVQPLVPGLGHAHHHGLPQPEGVARLGATLTVQQTARGVGVALLEQLHQLAYLGIRRWNVERRQQFRHPEHRRGQKGPGLVQRHQLPRRAPIQRVRFPRGAQGVGPQRKQVGRAACRAFRRVHGPKGHLGNADKVQLPHPALEQGGGEVAGQIAPAWTGKGGRGHGGSGGFN